MDPSSVLSVLVAFGLGGIVTNFIKDATARRTMRADVLDAQRKLTEVAYEDLDGFDAAIAQVQRQAMIAGLPQWLLRNYGGIAGLERHERDVELSGQPLEDESGYEIKRIPRQVVASSYRDTETKFNFAIWHPWLVYLRAPVWRWQFNRFWRSIGFTRLAKQMRRDGEL